MPVAPGSLLAVAALLPVLSGCDCTLQTGVELIGSQVAPPTRCPDPSGCCASCAADPACLFFTFVQAESGGLCLHKSAAAPGNSRHNDSCVSGRLGGPPPSPPPAKEASVAVGGLVWRGGPNHVCWNIDASANRGFFWRNLSAASSEGGQLARLAAQIGAAQEEGFSLLRFGGAGNDYLTYAFGGMPCPTATEYSRCLNETTWRDLLSFTAAARAKLVFGLSMNIGPDRHSSSHRRWIADNARAILQWTIDQRLDHLIYGLELGNELNYIYTAAEQAGNMAVLHNLTLELWPDPQRRPRLFGPDARCMLFGRSSPSCSDWIVDWLEECSKLRVPVHAVTHHQYTELDPTVLGFTSPYKLSMNAAVASSINRTVREHSSTVLVFGGEVGPHNAGSPPCDHTQMRWASFGDSLWYADDLAAMAQNGYSGLCREDFIGADYGMVDCLTGTPLPDYYTGLLWARTMGPRVLDAVATVTETGAVLPPANSTLRIYAHCTTKRAGSVTVLAINLANSSTHLRVSRSLGSTFEQYELSSSRDAASSLSGRAGLLGTGALLNRHVLKLSPDGTVPPMLPVVGSSSGGMIVPQTALTFFVFPDANHASCT